jgi:hypothetical protein
MKNYKLIKILEEINTCFISDIVVKDIFLDYEYLLRYLEINSDNIIYKYKSFLPDLWEEKLIKSLLFLYHNYESNRDVRLLNILYKYRGIIRSMSISYQDKKLYDLIYFNLNERAK